MQKLYKRYIDVIVRTNKNGEQTPKQVIWENGTGYSIDKIIDVERRASRVGGCGLCYTCVISGVVRYLYLEKNRWFIESHQP